MNNDYTDIMTAFYKRLKLLIDIQDKAIIPEYPLLKIYFGEGSQTAFAEAGTILCRTIFCFICFLIIQDGARINYVRRFPKQARPCSSK